MTPEVASVTEAFERFFRSQYDDLVRLAHLLTGTATVAEELVQEALLATHQRWDSLDNPAGYVRRALVNLCRSHHRRRFLERRYMGSGPPPQVLPADIDETWAVI